MISANKLYQESGTSLSFKEWLEREKAKGNFIPNANALEQFNSVDGVNDTPKEEKADNSVLIRNVAIVGVVLVIGYFILKKK